MNDATASQRLDRHTYPGTTSRWLPRVRAAWLGLIALIFITFVYSIPGTYQMLTTPCDLSPEQCVSWAQPSPEMLETLAQLGISLESAAIYHLILFLADSLVFWGAGLLVLRYRSHDWHGLLVSYLLIALGAGGVSLVFMGGQAFTDIPTILGMVSGLTVLPLYLALSLFFLTFPDGRVYPRWTWGGLVLILLNYTAWMAPGKANIQNWPTVLAGLWLLLVFGGHITIQGYRYRYYYHQEQRQQTKWLIFGFGIVLVTAIGSSLFGDLLFGGRYSDLMEGTVVALGFYLPIALAVTIAIVRYRLWDIDIVINRTLVYGVLTASVIGIYALIVGGLSALVEDDNSFVISLLGAGVIAIIFQPLRVSMQRASSRLMFGRRDEPLAVMTQLGKGLEATLSPEAALAHLVETIAGTLKLPYVAVEWGQEDDPIAHGSPRADLHHFPLIYHAQIIGHLVVSSRSPGEALNLADRLVLENVARQASAVVHAARLTADLQESRQRIVTAREEERRRLRRDLHDGLGPALATLTLQAETARDLIPSDPDKSQSLLAEIIEGTQNALADIRRVVYALRPPALDDLGLISALRELAASCAKPDLQIRVDAPEQLPPLPAAVEVAIYRIAQEALTNVMRHAAAHHCTVHLAVNDDVELEIIDDGQGIPPNRRAGVGLNSMHERTLELGGFCEIESATGIGTQIRVKLPCR